MNSKWKNQLLGFLRLHQDFTLIYNSCFNFDVFYILFRRRFGGVGWIKNRLPNVTPPEYVFLCIMMHYVCQGVCCACAKWMESIVWWRQENWHKYAPWKYNRRVFTLWKNGEWKIDEKQKYRNICFMFILANLTLALNASTHTISTFERKENIPFGLMMRRMVLLFIFMEFMWQHHNYVSLNSYLCWWTMYAFIGIPFVVLFHEMPVRQTEDFATPREWQELMLEWHGPQRMALVA